MAAIYDRFMRGMEDACGAAWRAEILSDIAGDVLEIGGGTGANLAHYPSSVGRLVITEPDRHMAARLRRKLAASALAGRAEVVERPVEALDLPPASFDVAVSTLVLCSVADPAAVLRSLRTWLRPGGRLVFLEHVASDDPDRLAWQRRIEPIWKHVAGNCHLCRRTEASIEAAGFGIESIRRESARKAMPIVRPTIRGVARKPDL